MSSEEVEAITAEVEDVSMNKSLEPAEVEEESAVNENDDTNVELPPSVAAFAAAADKAQDEKAAASSTPARPGMVRQGSILDSGVIVVQTKEEREAEYRAAVAAERAEKEAAKAAEAKKKADERAAAKAASASRLAALTGVDATATPVQSPARAPSGRNFTVNSSPTPAVATPLAVPAVETSSAVKPPAEAGYFSHDQLKSGIPDGVDPSNKELYLDDATFLALFKVDKAAFAGQPKWKRDQKKKDLGLF